MARTLNKLTAVSLKSLKVKKKLSDGGGLYLLPDSPTSGTWWLKYRGAAGAETRCSFGRYPAVSLAEARQRRDDAKAQIRKGLYPNDEKNALKMEAKRASGALFPVVAQAWLVEQEKQVKAKLITQGTYDKRKYVTETYLVPMLRKESVTTLKAKQAIPSLVELAMRVPEMARKSRQALSGIIAYAIREDLRDEDKPLVIARGALPRCKKVLPPAATQPKAVRELYRFMTTYESPVVRSALTILMLTAQRPGNVVQMRWEELDLDEKEWHIPAERMKMRIEHVVPLSRQALAAVEAMRPFTGGMGYVFPALAKQETAHLSRDTLSLTLRENGFRGKHTPHRSRTTLRTVARERLAVDGDILEAQLAHAKEGETNEAYDRTQFLDQRHDVMQEWADYLDALLAGTAGRKTKTRD
ncbi:tyrosine-type recombinase/integrase [Xanthomonas arboricola]|uniref:tyrosine-type recombinase/integrase n=1 Tax=Xanthomonas arboricola TaxID=56448 RepID=UPI0015E3E77B|nr:integrase arm-type DNA-binding domain-containing protein [Xanthomonas arboricola]